MSFPLRSSCVFHPPNLTRIVLRFRAGRVDASIDTFYVYPPGAGTRRRAGGPQRKSFCDPQLDFVLDDSDRPAVGGRPRADAVAIPHQVVRVFLNIILSYACLPSRAFITILLSTVGLIKQALILLNYLVFAPDPNVNLALRLHQASHRQFNGISHMFVVTLGRLTYAEPPDEVGDEEKVVLEQIAGTFY